MRNNDQQSGSPDVCYSATKAFIESTFAYAGMRAYATDTGLMGYYNGSAWVWGDVQPGHIIQDSGVAETQRPMLNFTGYGMVVTDDVSGSRTVVTITSGSNVPHTIQNSGSALNWERNLNFNGYGVSAADNASGSRTDVTVVSGSNVPHVVKNSGIVMNQRQFLNFTGDIMSVTDDASGSATTITVNAAGSAGGQVKIPTGSTLPDSPVNGQLFQHTPTGRNVLAEYDGANWNYLQGFGDITYYVNGASGSNMLNNGYASGSGAFRSIQFAIDAVPSNNTGSVFIYIASGSYTENLNIGRINFEGDKGLYLSGSLVQYATVTSSGSSIQGSGSVQGNVIASGSAVTDLYKNKILLGYSGSNAGIYKVIDNNTGNTINVVPGWATKPGLNDVYRVMDWNVQINGLVNIYGARVFMSCLGFYSASGRPIYATASEVYLGICQVYGAGAVQLIRVSGSNNLNVMISTTTGGYSLVLEGTSIVLIDSKIGANSETSSSAVQGTCIQLIGGGSYLNSGNNVLRGGIYGILNYNQAFIYAYNSNPAFSRITSFVGVYSNWGAILRGVGSFAYTSNVPSSGSNGGLNG